MKKTLCLILLLALLLSGCGNSADTPETTQFKAQYPTVSSTEPEGTQEEILAYRRDVVEAEMRRMMSMLWTPAEDVTYSIVNNSQGVEADQETQPKQIITLYADRIYQGMPYTHGGGSGYSFLDQATAVDENGVYTLDLTNADLNGNANQSVNVCSRLGNDCADAIFWAWNQVSTTITFPGSGRMTEYYGCVKVGDYLQPYDDLRVASSTKEICQSNGEQRMFSCYAQMQKGDAATNSGHGVMIVSVHVAYDADGGIDGEKSYAVILEQGSTCEKAEKSYYNEELGQTVYLCEELDQKRSFDTLYAEGYLPVTCKELVDASPLDAVAVDDSVTDPSASNLFSGTVSANYRISSVTITITDKKGNTVQTATCYAKQSESGKFNLNRFIDPVEKTVMKGYIDLYELKNGQYKCTCTCQISTGATVTFREFEFLK